MQIMKYFVPCLKAKAAGMHTCHGMNTQFQKIHCDLKNQKCKKH